MIGPSFPKEEHVAKVDCIIRLNTHIPIDPSLRTDIIYVNSSDLHTPHITAHLEHEPRVVVRNTKVSSEMERRYGYYPFTGQLVVYELLKYCRVSRVFVTGFDLYWYTHRFDNLQGVDRSKHIIAWRRMLEEFNSRLIIDRKLAEVLDNIPLKEGNSY